MSRPKRYFPVSHDILSDPEMRSLLDELGERFWRFWLWILSKTDQAENAFSIPTMQALETSWKMLGIYPKSGWEMLGKCLGNGWIVARKAPGNDQEMTGKVLENDFPIILSTRNYKKYHRTQVHDGKIQGPLLTNLTNLTNLTPKVPMNGATVAIETFWKTYPKKKGKGNVEKWFVKNHPDDELLTKIISKIEQLKTSHDWTKEQGKYIPHPATWLNAKGWEDEIQHATVASSFTPPPFPPKTDPIARNQWRAAYGDPAKWGYS